METDQTRQSIDERQTYWRGYMPDYTQSWKTDTARETSGYRQTHTEELEHIHKQGDRPKIDIAELENTLASRQTWLQTQTHR